ncbi:MAG: hypothetical protein ACRCTU_15755 [Zoogloea sp.]|uniref:hypothetical protein n=1 Tax=Zoogloea sp. TaxID=49181 RepID=UPI003F2AEAB6
MANEIRKGGPKAALCGFVFLKQAEESSLFSEKSDGEGFRWLASWLPGSSAQNP